ncbi:uncharacterized protein KY384_001783 [Bacidia gigantensis]|uniref:uncharacterized protein n=1 Tax=Bacidia gigantensis TaxID=2732470 RepID=UPI001D04ECAF|nr:uncharacterized protein KY384_001783 [Bacidia gigantensis]KAG8533001.1 hypothetical protein KY384_001783 [Bacidia gigantensis]
MSAVQVMELVARQAYQSAAATTTAAAAAAATDEAPPACVADNDFDGRLGVRISAIFVILLGSTIEWAFFIAKYFGSGVIIATAFIHLLAPANEALSNPCLTGPITSYSWVEGIALMTTFALFFVELMAMRYATFGHPPHDDANAAEHGHAHTHGSSESASLKEHKEPSPSRHAPGEDHLSHARSHIDHEDAEAPKKDLHRTPSTATEVATPPQHLQSVGIHEVEDYAAQLTAILILEFGVIFHSIFIGLTLAVAGSEFNTLYIVLVFHQTFEGLGLGSRLAATPWPKGRTTRFTPYWFAVSYGLSTPIAIAIGLGLRTTYAPGSQTSLIVNGVFDSISAGILIYTGLVELMAHEFMFSAVMRRARLSVVMSAFGIMCAGAGLMALLGKWA